MGDQLFLERFIWFDNEARRERYPNASKLAIRFEIATKSAQRSIDYFRDRLLAPLQYEVSHKGYFYTDPTFQLPVSRAGQSSRCRVNRILFQRTTSQLCQPDGTAGVVGSVSGPDGNGTDHLGQKCSILVS